MWDRSDIFDQLHVQASGLQCGDRAFATRAWAFDTNFNVTHAKLAGLFSSLLSRTLTSERGALATTLESTGSGTGPTQGVTLGIGNRDGRVVERCMNVGDTVGNVAPNAFFLVGLCHSKGLYTNRVVMLVCSFCQRILAANSQAN